MLQEEGPAEDAAGKVQAQNKLRAIGQGQALGREPAEMQDGATTTMMMLMIRGAEHYPRRHYS